MRISRSHALCQNIVNSRRFHDGSHSPAGDDTGTGGGRLQNNRGSSELAEHLMRNCGFLEGHVDHVSFCRFHSLAYSLGNFVRLAKAVPDLAVAVPNHHYCTERKTSAAFNDFGHPAYMDYLVYHLELA